MTDVIFFEIRRLLLRLIINTFRSIEQVHLPIFENYGPAKLEVVEETPKKCDPKNTKKYFT